MGHPRGGALDTPGVNRLSYGGVGKGKRKREQAATLQISAVAEKRDAVAPPFYLSTLDSIPTMAYPLTTLEAIGISAVRRCVTLIANSIAGRPWREVDGPRDLSPSRLVRRPAGAMTRREWAWRMVAGMCLEDIVHVLMVGGVDDEGVPGSLIPLPRDAISSVGKVDPFGVFPPTAYRISGTGQTISSEFVIPVRSTFWPGIPPHLVGILRLARNTMMQAFASDNYAARYWQAGGPPTTVISTDAELDDPQAEEIGNRWRNRRAMGPDFPAVLGFGANAKEFGADLAAQSGTEARRELVIDIGRLFGVPAPYLNVSLTGTSMTYSNLTDEVVSLDRFTLAGFYEPMQDLITDLLPNERRMLIDMTGITQGSQESRYRAWQAATGSKPWMDPEEVRAKEGLPPGAPEPDPPPAPASPSGVGDQSEVGANA